MYSVALARAVSADVEHVADEAAADVGASGILHRRERDAELLEALRDVHHEKRNAGVVCSGLCVSGVGRTRPGEPGWTSLEECGHPFSGVGAPVQLRGPACLGSHASHCRRGLISSIIAFAAICVSSDRSEESTVVSAWSRVSAAPGSCSSSMSPTARAALPSMRSPVKSKCFVAAGPISRTARSTAKAGYDDAEAGRRDAESRRGVRDAPITHDRDLRPTPDTSTVHEHDRRLGECRECRFGVGVDAPVRRVPGVEVADVGAPAEVPARAPHDEHAHRRVGRKDGAHLADAGPHRSRHGVPLRRAVEPERRYVSVVSDHERLVRVDHRSPVVPVRHAQLALRGSCPAPTWEAALPARRCASAP